MRRLSSLLQLLLNDIRHVKTKKKKKKEERQRERGEGDVKLAAARFRGKQGNTVGGLAVLSVQKKKQVIVLST